jgi:Ion channel
MDENRPVQKQSLMRVMSRQPKLGNDLNSERGFLTSAVKKALDYLKYLSPIGLLGRVHPNFITPAAIEGYVLACLFLELTAAVTVAKIAGWASWVVLALAALKILEIIRTTVSVVLFDEGAATSVQRTFILAAINFLELGLCYGLFYSLHKDLLAGYRVGALTGFYFSFMMQLIIGSGDVHPIGWLRILAVIQGLTAVLFVLLVFAKIVASPRPLRA